MPEVMLDELEVSDVALIEHACLSFSPHLTALTGETGAGKTALLHALSLVIGQRAEAGMVRDGAAQARIDASFAFCARAEKRFSGCFEDGLSDGAGEDASFDDGASGHDASADAGKLAKGTADDAGAAGGEAGFVRDVVVSRRVSADGRSKCRIDGSLVAVGTLSRAVGPLIDLYGQHEHQTLLDPRHHLALLDAFIGTAVEGPLADYRHALDAYHEARAALDEAVSLQLNAEQVLEQARFTCSAIDEVDPREGEYEQLEADLPRLQHADELAQAVSAALGALSGGDEGGIGGAGASDLLAQAVDALGHASSVDPALDACRSSMQDALYGVDDAGRELRDYLDSLDHDEAALDSTLERLSQLGSLMRRFGPRMADVLEQRAKARRTIELTDDADVTSARLEHAEQDARAALEQAARSLEELRGGYADAFGAELSDSVSELGMEGAVFSLSVVPGAFCQWGRSGPARYEILYAPGPGITPRPLARIASGGELSRIMLAFKTLVESDDEGRIMVFDEIDAGLGGKTATAVADRLERLAHTHQVIVVTHLPQIASRADEQLLVEKTVDEDRISTTIRALDGEERVVEIARMLSGTADEVAMAHARALVGACEREERRGVEGTQEPKAGSQPRSGRKTKGAKRPSRPGNAGSRKDG